MRPSRISAALLACLATCIASAISAHAQTRTTPVSQKAAPASPVARPAAAQAEPARGDPAKAGKPVSERLLDARWVLFPARLALVIVFLTLALFLLMSGAWGATRVAHSLRHMKWSQPPRRLKRGEVGAAGTSVALEREERLNTNIENDDERDRQIASLCEVVERLAREHNEIAATVAVMGRRGGSRPNGEQEDVG
jgi:hypothetical protein